MMESLKCAEVRATMRGSVAPFKFHDFGVLWKFWFVQMTVASLVTRFREKGLEMKKHDICKR